MEALKWEPSCVDQDADIIESPYVSDKTVSLEVGSEISGFVL